MRRRDRDDRGVFPERLARFREGEWSGVSVWDRMRAWMEKRSAYIRDQGWLESDPGLWLDAMRATNAAAARVRRKASRRSASGWDGPV